jgi:hypothetical protein
VRGIIDLGRPVITGVGGPQSAGTTGLDINWPYFDGDLTTIVAAQANEKDEVNSVQVSIEKGTASLGTYAAGSDISYQLLQRSQPSYLDAHNRIMAASYSTVTDRKFTSDLWNLGTGTVNYDMSGDTTGAAFRAAVFEASMDCEDATGVPASIVYASTALMQEIGGWESFYPAPYRVQNVSGVATASTLQVNVSGLRVVRAKWLDGNPAMNAVITNGEAVRWIEDGPRLANAENVGSSAATSPFMDTESRRPTCRLASSESSRRNRGAAHRDATGHRIGPHLCGGPVRPGSSVGRRRSELSHYGGGTGGRARSPEGSDLGNRDRHLPGTVRSRGRVCRPRHAGEPVPAELNPVEEPGRPHRALHSRREHGRMTALTTEARLAITTSMTGLGYKVYTSTPQVPIPPSIVIMADSPWVVPERLGRKSYRTQWRLVVVVNPRKNSAAQLDAEDAIDTILGALPVYAVVTDVGPPTLVDVGAQGSVITVDIRITAAMKE